MNLRVAVVVPSQYTQYLHLFFFGKRLIRQFGQRLSYTLDISNPSAYWLPEIKIVDEVGGTEYTVTGSYEGTETLDKKLRRIMEHNAANDNSDITEDSE